MSNLRPFGHHTITPSFIVPEAAKVVTFLERVFDAKVVDRYDGPNDTLLHAELLIQDTAIMCGEPVPSWPPMPAAFSYYVDSEEAVERVYRKALEAGATSIEPPNTQPWGYRSARVKDCGGNHWTICSVIEIVPRAEILRRMEAMMKGQAE